MRRELETVLQIARDLKVEQLPELLGELEQVRVSAMARLTTPVTVMQAAERLLDVREAAKKLGVSDGYLYRNHHRYPFVLRAGRKLLFSASGIEQYLRSSKRA